MTDTRVNFLFLGGDKCGSSWLDFILRQHPEMCLANAKELFFFDRFHDRGLDWYNRQFAEGTDSLRTGEICHDYLYSQQAVRRIGLTLPPTARCLVILRHPVMRTLSHYQYLIKIGSTRAPLAEALRIHEGLIDHSIYAPRIAHALKHIGPDRLRVLWHDDLVNDAADFGRQVSAALGIRFLPGLPYEARVLGAAQSRAPTATRLLRTAGWRLRQMGGHAIVGAIKSNRLVQRTLFTPGGVKISHVEKDALSPHLARFREDYGALKDLLGSVPDWSLETT
jgi:hypothetical protein